MTATQAPRPYSEAEADARAARDATIPAAYGLPKSCFPLPKNVTTVLESSGILSADELAIVNLDATALASVIAARKVSAVAAAKAYVKAAAVAQQVTNCVVELFEDEALERAAWLDAELARTGKTVGPFHGVPVSIKDHINVKGHDSPSTFIGLVGKMVAEEDSHAVKILRDAGAVFFVKTTNPQTLMAIETDSYLGVTTSPWNTDTTSGGSSGGEGAILAFKASALGVGSDIGGSVRAPAASTGIYSFKPGFHRLPNAGIVVPVGPEGYDGILSTQGPMARSVRDLELYMRVMGAAQPWLSEPVVESKPWREVAAPTKLRIGVLEDDGVIRPVAPVRRALAAAVEKLKAAGHEIVPYKQYDYAENWDVLRKLYFIDNGDSVHAQLARGNEPIKPLIKWALRAVGTEPISGIDYFKLVGRRDAFRYNLAQYWRAQNVDVVLSPVLPGPAALHGNSKYWGYTCYWNFANYPAGVFPTGLHVDPALDAEDGSYAPRNEDEAHVYATYDAAKQANAPLGLQVIGYAGSEEETLAAMKVISEVVQA
ncbi:hypothetical protein VHUM_04089 [Vanrija humicola]|uniref:amidase n=1 Tax=Vanrija humicola TaxID=5417 RepID=A0A7D8YT21_VANHU|nr:hypothetical protein VHUM_04089 [Vanrija humicola]